MKTIIKLLINASLVIVLIGGIIYKVNHPNQYKYPRYK
jgi:hypothetical protein